MLNNLSRKARNSWRRVRERGESISPLHGRNRYLTAPFYATKRLRGDGLAGAGAEVADRQPDMGYQIPSRFRHVVQYRLSLKRRLVLSYVAGIQLSERCLEASKYRVARLANLLADDQCLEKICKICRGSQGPCRERRRVTSCAAKMSAVRHSKNSCILSSYFLPSSRPSPVALTHPVRALYLQTP